MAASIRQKAVSRAVGRARVDQPAVGGGDRVRNGLPVAATQHAEPAVEVDQQRIRKQDGRGGGRRAAGRVAAGQRGGARARQTRSRRVRREMDVFGIMTR